eukprot:Lankesteria_metandrocarpae@DN3800_c0_g1_i2.p1
MHAYCSMYACMHTVQCTRACILFNVRVHAYCSMYACMHTVQCTRACILFNVHMHAVELLNALHSTGVATVLFCNTAGYNKLYSTARGIAFADLSPQHPFFTVLLYSSSTTLFTVQQQHNTLYCTAAAQHSLLYSSSTTLFTVQQQHNTLYCTAAAQHSLLYSSST